MLDKLVQLPSVVGAKQTLKAIKVDQIEVVFLAQDADLYITAPIRLECENRGIKVVDVETMTELGKACGIEVGSAVAGIMKTTTN